jgi:hypothetical protein
LRKSVAVPNYVKRCVLPHLRDRTLGRGLTHSGTGTSRGLTARIIRVGSATNIRAVRQHIADIVRAWVSIVAEGIGRHVIADVRVLVADVTGAAYRIIAIRRDAFLAGIVRAQFLPIAPEAVIAVYVPTAFPASVVLQVGMAVTIVVQAVAAYRITV